MSEELDRGVEMVATLNAVSAFSHTTVGNFDLAEMVVEGMEPKAIRRLIAAARRLEAMGQNRLREIARETL